MTEGQCHCGAVHYELSGDPGHNSLCHCSDCRRHAGAPMVGWAGYPSEALTVEGETKVYASSEHGRRHFCPECGTGLFYYNEVALPGIVDVQTATFDDPGANPPQLHVQFAERLGWMDEVDRLPKFARYPGQDE
jgi:hypothetical protein